MILLYTHTHTHNPHIGTRAHVHNLIIARALFSSRRKTKLKVVQQSQQEAHRQLGLGETRAA